MPRKPDILLRVPHRVITARALWKCIALPCVALAIGIASAEVTIDPEKQAGATVEYFGWDLKGWQNNAHTQEKAEILYRETPANIVRIPIIATAHRANGSVDEAAYGPMLQSIANIRSVNRETKIFASLKLQKQGTFPAWVRSQADGQIFDARVKCPAPAQYARLVADYIEWLSEHKVAIDYLGLNNEVSKALTPERYIATAEALEAELQRRGVEETYRSFEFIGGEGFGIPTSIRYLQHLKANGGMRYAQIMGSHFYPDLDSGSGNNWPAMAALAPARPTWHTEVHMRGSEVPRENITMLRDGLALLFWVNKAGAEGFIWWAQETGRGSLGNQIRRKVISSLLHGHCIATSGNYWAKGNKDGKSIAQATLVGDTVWLWYLNPGEAKTEFPVSLRSGRVTEVSAEVWTGGGSGSHRQLRVTSSRLDGRILVEEIPAQSICLLQIDLAPGSFTPGASEVLLVGEREWTSGAVGSQKVRASLLSVEGATGHFRRADGSEFTYPLNQLSAADQELIAKALKE